MPGLWAGLPLEGAHARGWTRPLGLFSIDWIERRGRVLVRAFRGRCPWHVWRNRRRRRHHRLVGRGWRFVGARGERGLVPWSRRHHGDQRRYHRGFVGFGGFAGFGGFVGLGRLGGDRRLSRISIILRRRLYRNEPRSEQLRRVRPSLRGGPGLFGRRVFLGMHDTPKRGQSADHQVRPALRRSLE